MRNKILSLLALLLTAVTGAWADEPKVYTTAVDVTSLKVGDILAQGFSLTSTNPNGDKFNIADQRGKRDETIHPGGYGGISTKNITAYGANATFTTADGTYYPIDENSNVGNAWVVTQECNQPLDMDLIIAGVTIELPLTVAWDATTKTGTFTQPGSDVVLTPLYAPVAAWAEVETVKQLPAAAEGVIAGTDDPLIVEGIVAFAGTSTEVTQGTVMYAVTPATVTDASELKASDWKNTVPTAKNIADNGAEVKVWYYIQGADTPDGETATADNTFNDSEICTTPLTVTVRSNKFDLAFKAANANTIEAGKATVTVGGTAATVTDGKLEGVKMGSEVKMTAKQGYKFRKVEVKKGGPTYPVALSAVTADYVGSVVCSDGNVYPAKTAVPSGCTAVGILGKVTETGHGLILALQNATSQNWNTINGWTSETTYAGTTLKMLDDAARSNLTSYTTLGETTVSNWAVAQKSDYEAIFTNLGSTKKDNDGTTYDANVNAYITTGVGGTAISGDCWSATDKYDDNAWVFFSNYWDGDDKAYSHSVRPVLGF